MRYTYVECHFTQEELVHSAPEKKEGGNLFKIHNTLHTLALILTFHISLGLSARKTAFVLRNVFQINISFQTVLNYSEIAAYQCHKFNMAFKGDVDSTQVGDEVYSKVSGHKWFTFLFISPSRRKITAYHCSPERDELAATISLKEAFRTVSKNTPEITAITDGLSSYIPASNYLSQQTNSHLSHKKVFGLQNLDTESETYRPFKQMCERLNRTFRFHTNSASGFKEPNGLITMSTLFTTHYNFLRPHQTLNFDVPCPLEQLQGIPTLQGKWAEILHIASKLS